MNAVLARLAAVGTDDRDDEAMKRRKALLVLISVLILPIAVVWGSLYLIFGSWVGYVPFAYALILLGAIVAFAGTRNFALLLHVNLVDILLAPTLSMIPLGGFLASGASGSGASSRRSARLCSSGHEPDCAGTSLTLRCSSHPASPVRSWDQSHRFPSGSRARCSVSTSPWRARSSSF